MWTVNGTSRSYIERSDHEQSLEENTGVVVVLVECSAACERIVGGKCVLRRFEGRR